MRDNDDLFVEDTIAAYEFLGAKGHAQIIRELIPMAEERWRAIRAAEAAGVEFDYDNNPFKALEPRWDKACKQFDFYKVIFRDMKQHPEKYTHP